MRPGVMLLAGCHNRPTSGDGRRGDLVTNPIAPNFPQAYPTAQVETRDLGDR